MWTQSSFRTWFDFGNARWSHAEAMHGSISPDCAVGTKYYLAVRRSWSWLGRRLQCMWTHVVQITIPITFWIMIRNVFRNVILAYVNTANVLPGIHSSARCMHLKSWHLLHPIANLSFACSICWNFIPTETLSSNSIFCNFIYNANGISKTWEFYRLRPFAGNKQCVFIVSLPPFVSFCQAHNNINEKQIPEQNPIHV